MKVLIAAIGSLILFTACGPQSNSGIQSDTDTAIINGEPVGSSDDIVKSVASIQSVNSPTDTVHRCTGVFIHRKVILTAAHCFFDQVNGRSIARDVSRMGIALGTNVQNARRFYSIAAVKAHPSFDPNGSLCRRGEYKDTPPAWCETFDKGKNQSADIGLVFLNDDPGPSVVPVAPFMGEPTEGFYGVTVGYGYSQHTSELKTVAARRRAVGVLNSVELWVRFKIIFGDEPAGLMFTSDAIGVQFDNLWLASGGKHVFTNGGDSGGPLFARDNKTKRIQLVGILTGAGDKTVGQAYAMNHTYNIYIRMKSNLSWIRSQLKSLR